MMTDDERAIREVVAKWLRASREGDTQTVLDLMADDVVFLTPGKKPFGKEEFRQSQASLAGTRIDAESNIREVKVFGDRAYIWTDLRVVMTPEDGGQPVKRSGNTLTIFERLSDGRWVLSRDANLLALEG